MCGIFGFSRRTPEAVALMPFLAKEMVGRGKDSWGVTDGTRILKKLGPIIHSWELPEWGDSLVFHTRAGSVGDKTVENQHPFAFAELDEEGAATGGIYVGVHNGGISNHADINKKYNRDFKVDSMHVYAHLAEGWPIDELSGYGGLVWFYINPTGKKTLYFARINMFDLHVFEIETNPNSLVFCSTKSPVEEAAALLDIPISEFTFAEGKIHWLIEEDNKQTLCVGEKIAFKNSNYAARRGRYGTASYDDDWESWNEAYGSNLLWYAKNNVCPKCHYAEAHCHCTSEDKALVVVPSHGFPVNPSRDNISVYDWDKHKEHNKALISTLFARAVDDKNRKNATTVDGCRKCTTGQIVEGVELICKSCLAKLITQYVAMRDRRYEYRLQA